MWTFAETDAMKALPVFLLSTVLSYVIAVAVYRLYFHSLAKFPGPKIAATTQWYEIYWDVAKRGQYLWRIKEMHDKYGPIVRINPHELHIIDPDFYDELYGVGSAKKLDKYDQWVKLAGAPGSTFSTVSHDVHRTRRGALNPFFSKRSVQQLEPLIRSKVEKLSDRFSKLSVPSQEDRQRDEQTSRDLDRQTEQIMAAGQPVDDSTLQDFQTQVMLLEQQNKSRLMAAKGSKVVRLEVVFMALTMDIICDYAFADDRKYLDEDDFKLQWKETINGAWESGAMLRAFPWILPVTKAMPISFIEKGDPNLAYLLKWQAGVREQVSAILNEKAEEKQEIKRTIFHALKDSDLPPSERTLDRLCDEGEIITGAGSETTAKALTHISFYLSSHRDVRKKLRAELKSVMPEPGTVIPLPTLEQLPYLTAVIQEGLRLSYGITTRLPRVLPGQVLKYKQWEIPPGTPVSQTPYFILVHPGVFPKPEEFVPERWLESGKEGHRLDKYMVAFGKGSRQCVGINLAYAELYLAVSTIFRRFDLQLYETGLKDVQIKHDFFASWPDLSSKGVRAQILKIDE